MNQALWKKAFAESWRTLLVGSLLLALFAWLFVWWMGQFNANDFGLILRLLPNFIQPLLGVPLKDLASPAGQSSILFVHVITQLVFIGWAIGQGSDVVSGQISRGTMEHLAALPVWRATLVLIPALVALMGSMVLVAALLLGMGAGLATVRLGQPIPLAQFLPGAMNLLTMTFCLTGASTLLSAWDHDRWRSIKLAGGFYLLSFLVKVLARAWPSMGWLRYASFLTAFEPQWLVLRADAGSLAVQYNVVLVLFGLACYTAATVTFVRRDIPVSR